MPRARLDAELLLAHVLGTDRLSLYLQHDRPVVPAELDRYRELLRRRGRREPLQLLTGSVQFLDHEFAVRPGVFLPRPETERLVQRCLGLSYPSGEAPATIVELGTGTGCVGLSLLAAWPGARLVAFELDPPAVQLTRDNASALGVADRLELHEADGLDTAHRWPACELVVSNPPYLADGELAGLEPEVREHDPARALACGEDALAVLRGLAVRARGSLRPGGWLVVEHGDSQGGEVGELLRGAGLEGVVLEQDLAGRDRIHRGQQPPA